MKKALSFSHIIACALLLFCAAANAQETMTATEKENAFNEANHLFREANKIANTHPQKAKELYGKAALHFEKIINEGKVKNGKLYYNTGNAYFRMGDTGRTILNYRRAEKFMKGDANLAQNLAYARSRRIDKMESATEAKVFHVLLFWHYDLPLHIRGSVFFVFFVLFWVMATTRIARRKFIPKWLMVLCALVALAFAASVLTEERKSAQHPAGVITAGEVTARKGDDLSYQPSFKEPLHSGTEFTMLEKRGEWLHVELTDGRACWLPENSVELVEG